MKRQQANQQILSQIQALKQNHPAWGYRRIWSYLKYRNGLNVNKKRIYRLMKKNNLLVMPNWRLKAVRKAHTRKPKAFCPNQLWGIDMTKILIPSYGWVYLTVVIDWYSKKIVGHDLAVQSKALDWLNALNKAVNNQFPEGIKNKKRSLFLVSDNGSQPTSSRFMADCRGIGIKQIFTSYNNPRGNADTERVIRTIKEDLVWVNEFDSVNQLSASLDEWVHSYNEDYPHSSIGYATPCEYERTRNAA